MKVTVATVITFNVKCLIYKLYESEPHFIDEESSNRDRQFMTM